MPNQAVFISGFKIAIRDNVVGRRWVEVEVDAHSQPGRIFNLGNSGKGKSRSGKLWRSLLSRSGGNSETGEQAEAGSADDPEARSPESMDVGGHVTVSHMPETLKVCSRYHTHTSLPILT